MDKNTRIQNLVRELNTKDGFNGAWLYAEGGEIVSKGVLGFRDPEDTLPITEDTIFQLASISKTFTSAAVMLLMRQGHLSPEDEITKFRLLLPTETLMSTGSKVRFPNELTYIVSGS